ncbi:slit3 protein-like [Tropilaelaps mercedesae]|uniref:Slit3 protein-like n=1 Tax=Tropilaelaps mercedesae TaxID=418985 RepID=A0A1V9XE39_9ACAR|nr:slit3 protein-like [Tropilaelaps mercedesae]
MDFVRTTGVVFSIVCFHLWMAQSVPYISPEECSWELISEQTPDVSMVCSIQSLIGETEPANFSLTFPRRMAQLSIRCDNKLLRSELVNGSFKHLQLLQKLHVENCRFDSLPSDAFAGLSSLKHLVVKTLNSDWTDMSLQVSSTSFRPLTRIEFLDLSTNNMERLPANSLCGLDQLHFVNLTHNQLSSVGDIGFTTEPQCRLSIQQLDMSYNRFKALPERSFASLPSLKELRLSHNQIARAESGSLTGLVQLETLNLAHNGLIALASALFRSTPKLSKLYLRNNSLSALPPGLFNGLDQIVVLDLAHNQLSSLEWLGSDGPLHLHHLDLSHNRLARLDPDAFRTIVDVQSLYLQNNLIEHLESNTFALLASLHTLMLSSNRLKTIRSHSFVGLSTVTTLYLDRNRLEDVDADAFSDVSALQELNVAGNRIRTLDFLSSLTMLRSLDLSDNEIENIANASYQGLGHLYALNLMGNRIGNISRGVFSNMSSVRILNIARNGIRTIEQNAFRDVSELHYLRLDSNELEDVNNLFSSFHDLIMLNISANRIRWFDYALIPSGLQWLDAHDNQIELLGDYFNLGRSIRLRTLDVSSNRLTDLDATSLPSGIEIVLLSNNSIKRIQPFSFLGKHNLTRVDLTNNLLEHIDMSLVRVSETNSSRPPPEFALARNPYLCDCHMDWLQRLQSPSTTLDNEVGWQHSRVVDLPNIECRLAWPNGPQTRPVVDVKPWEFLCGYRSHCASQCHCCDFHACNCEMLCPDNCSCYRDHLWNINIVDCSTRGHSVVRVPVDATTVYLDGNDIGALTPQSFAGLQRVQTLFVNKSNIATVHGRAFASMTRSLRVLRLNDNRLATLADDVFAGLSTLNELYLSNNQLTSVSNRTFVHLDSLRVLHLDHNHLVEMSLRTLQGNVRLIDLRLGDNPWTCRCDFTQHLADLLRKRGDTMRDMSEVSCLYNATMTLRLSELNVTDCDKLAEATSLIEQIRFQPVRDVVSLFVNLGFVLLLLLLLGTVVVVLVTVIIYRRKVKIWPYGRCGLRPWYRPTIEEEKLFDAFVSYSKRDELFVAQALASELEFGKPAYRLCLHYRDLPTAGGYLSDAIHEAVESSRRTIVVLSENFVKEDWCSYEFRSAHCEVLHNSFDKLIIIVVGQVCHHELDSDIRAWMKHSVFLHWGEHNFWDKLRASLPKARQRSLPCSDITSMAVHI